MNIEEIKEAQHNHVKFKIPQHKMFAVFPTAKRPICTGEGLIDRIEERSTAQALIIVCNSCDDRWGVPLENFPDVDAMDHEHLLLDPHHVYPLLPELKKEFDKDNAVTEYLANAITRKWGGSS